MYISICQHCHQDINLREEDVSGVRCDSCAVFVEGIYHHGMPPGWISLDFGEDDGQSGPQTVEGEPEYIERRDYCPACAMTLRDQLRHFALPYSRADPNKPESSTP